ncbi:hypothetical protein LMG28140_06190 [Paraburkholderia metrosideri]|uniref:Uncharacterized protein n=1 Tax=Paraburkholderia metrosideri TaxID=580937 RepID=A0ABN7IAJ7_9BURK|nr:hypothetical protein LMG28140_06190 [Paraburkholderia metrosideri]
MVTYRTVVVALDVHVHLESWAQAGSAQGCACDHSVHAGNGLILARPAHENSVWLGRDGRISGEAKGRWREGLVAQRLATTVSACGPDGLQTNDLRLVSESRGGGGPRIAPGSIARPRSGFRRAIPPKSSDMPAATVGAYLHDATQLLHLLDATAATHQRRDLSPGKPVVLRAGHGSGPDTCRRVVHHASGAAVSVVFVSAATVAATFPQHPSRPAARSSAGTGRVGVAPGVKTMSVDCVRFSRANGWRNVGWQRCN